MPPNTPDTSESIPDIDTDELRERYARHFYNNDGTPAAQDVAALHPAGRDLLREVKEMMAADPTPQK
jgi:hypothetical protein